MHKRQTTVDIAPQVIAPLKLLLRRPNEEWICTFRDFHHTHPLKVVHRMTITVGARQLRSVSITTLN